MRLVVYTVVFIISQLSSISAMFDIPIRCFLLDMDCAKNLIQKLIPPLSESLDPMYIDFLRINEPGFQGDISNLTVIGSKDAIIDNVAFDFGKREVIVQYHTDFTLNGRYKSSPVDPGADLSMLIKNIQINFVMPFEIIWNSNDYKFINLKAFKYDYKVNEDIKCYISDLYRHALRGGDFISAPKNFRLITIPFGRSFMDKIMGNVFELLKSYLLSQPLLSFIMY